MLDQAQIDIAQEVANLHEADIYVYSGPLDVGPDWRFRRIVKQAQTAKNVHLILATQGGEAPAAYRIGRCLQRLYKDGRFAVHLDWQCKSAGTLLVLGADNIIMADRAELGPLDVQIAKHDELFERSSGLTPVDALTFLRQQTFDHWERTFFNIRGRSGLQIPTRTAAEIASTITVGLFKGVYEQLDPMRLGEYHRAIRVAQEYGQRLSGGRANACDGALDRLIMFYPEHGFVIDRREARSLFKNVRAPNDLENALANTVNVQKTYSGDIPEMLWLAGPKVESDEQPPEARPDGLDGGEEDQEGDRREDPPVGPDAAAAENSSGEPRSHEP